MSIMERESAEKLDTNLYNSRTGISLTLSIRNLCKEGSLDKFPNVSEIVNDRN